MTRALSRALARAARRLRDRVVPPLSLAVGLKHTGLHHRLQQCREAGRAQEETKFGPEAVAARVAAGAAHYPLSFDKVMRMWRKLVRDQFVTFSEA